MSDIFYVDESLEVDGGIVLDRLKEDTIIGNRIVPAGTYFSIEEDTDEL